MKELTKAEEQVMQVLWELERGFVKDLLAKFPDPKPAYNTVSTMVRILEAKGFVAHKEYGKSHEYFPIISKDDYRELMTRQVVNSYFDGSPGKLVSYFIKEQHLDVAAVEQLLAAIEKTRQNPKP